MAVRTCLSNSLSSRYLKYGVRLYMAEAIHTTSKYMKEKKSSKAPFSYEASRPTKISRQTSSLTRPAC